MFSNIESKLYKLFKWYRFYTINLYWILTLDNEAKYLLYFSKFIFILNIKFYHF